MRFDFMKAIIPPDYDPINLVPQFETLAQVVQRQRQLVRVLLESELNYSTLITRLESCSDQAPCRSGACPICVRGFRRWWCSAVTQFVDNSPFEAWYAITIVDHRQLIPLGELNRFDPQAMKDRFRKRIERSELADKIMLGGIDVSLNRFEGRSPKWSPHIYVLCNAWNKKQIKSALKHHYPSTEDVRFPVKVTYVNEELKDYAWRSTYSFKMVFEEHPAKRTDLSNRSYPPIPEIYLPELSDALDQWGFGQRLIRRGYSPDLPEIRFR